METMSKNEDRKKGRKLLEKLCEAFVNAQRGKITVDIFRDQAKTLGADIAILISSKVFSKISGDDKKMQSTEIRKFFEASPSEIIAIIDSGDSSTASSQRGDNLLSEKEFVGALKAYIAGKVESEIAEIRPGKNDRNGALVFWPFARFCQFLTGSSITGKLSIPPISAAIRRGQPVTDELVSEIYNEISEWQQGQHAKGRVTVRKLEDYARSLAKHMIQERGKKLFSTAVAAKLDQKLTCRVIQSYFELNAYELINFIEAGDSFGDELTNESSDNTLTEKEFIDGFEKLVYGKLNFEIAMIGLHNARRNGIITAEELKAFLLDSPPAYYYSFVPENKPPPILDAQPALPTQASWSGLFAAGVAAASVLVSVLAAAAGRALPA